MQGKLIGEFRFGVDSEIKLAEQENYKNTQFALSIATPHRLYVLRFDSIQGRQDWMTMLKYAQVGSRRGAHSLFPRSPYLMYMQAPPTFMRFWHCASWSPFFVSSSPQIHACCHPSTQPACRTFLSNTLVCVKFAELLSPCSASELTSITTCMHIAERTFPSPAKRSLT